MDPTRKETQTVHAIGDGTFIVDGRRLDRKKMMADETLDWGMDRGVETRLIDIAEQPVPAEQDDER